jgi:hypothetical protein
MIKKFGLIVVGLALLIVACEPKPDNLKLLDEFVVSTNFDKEAVFETYATYAIAKDTIGFSSNQSNDTIMIQSEYNFPRPVLDQIRTNLNMRDFEQVDKDANPDLGISVTLVNDYNLFQQVVYPNGYYSGYYGYGGYYSYPYVNTYAYNTGVLIIEIVDLKNKTPDNKVKVIWTSYMGDVYSSVDPVKQAQEAIDQSFDQSPYLERE